MAVDAGKVALNPRGAYSSTTTYERLDVVTYQSNTYVALQTTLGNLPTDTSSWMALVKVDNASMSVRGLVKVDGTSITADADGTIHGHAAAGVNSFNGRDGDVLPEYGDYDAVSIAYDNTDSGLTSNRAQGAIDELTPKKIITADDAFDPTKTYAVGDWLIHQGVLYEVITACTGVTPPNATYYNPITLHELKNRIDALYSEKKVVLNSASMSLPEGVTFQGENSYVKVGRIVNLLVNLKITSTTKHQIRISNFIPNVKDRPVFDTANTLGDGDLDGIAQPATIKSSGTLELWNTKTGTTYAQGNIVYIAGDTD